jgi:cell division protein FtsI/penicillin-binding protein 2
VKVDVLHRKRSIVLNTTIIFGFGVIFFRLVILMVVDHQALLERAQSQQVMAENIQVRRGNIYDRKGRALAVNMEYESLYCDPKMVSIEKSELRQLSAALGTDPARLESKFETGKRFEWVERKIPQDSIKLVKSALEMDGSVKEPRVKGFGFRPEAERIYPGRRLAPHIIGAVGIDNQGIELKYNKYLSTSGGKVYFPRDASGKMVFSSGVDMEARGHDVVLTIDEVLQFIVEEELGKAMAKWQAAAATAIMMDPFTGEILALANKPDYDANEIGSASRNAVRDRAITDIYEPGSTFKIIVGTAALEENLVSLDTKFDCSKGGIEVGGKVIHDVHRHGVLTFKEVIQKSSNVGSVMIGMRLGKDRIYKYAKRYGFGDRTGIDLPGEVSGWIRKPDKWSATSIGAIPIGQEVAVTPLQVLRAYSAIANGGLLVKPHLVREIRTHEGQTVFAFDAGASRQERAISEKTAETFKDILKTVVEDGGTATGAALDGNSVAGKTGTAQLIDRKTRRYSRDRYISSFVGFVPADDPRLALIVVVFEPKGGRAFGGVVAGPVFKNIADKALTYMNVPRDDSREKNLLLVAQ